jgi:hypothetical protein
MISKVDVKDDKKKQKLKKIKKNVLLCVAIWKVMDFTSARIYRIYLGNKAHVAVLHNSKFYNISNLENGS